MLGFTIKKTQEIEAAKTALINAQAKAEANAKKFKTAVIAGSTSTGAAAAAIAAHFIFGNGKKINRNKLKNYDNIVEERNNALNEVNGLKAKCEHAEALAIAADGCCCRMSAAIDSKDPAEIYAAKQGHKQIHASIFGDVSQESVNAAVAAYDEFIKSLQNDQNQNQIPQNQNDQIPQNNQNNQNDQIPQNNQNNQNDQIPQNNQNAQNAQIPQNNQNAQNAQNAQIPQNNQNAQNAQKIADAQNRYNDACAKAGAAKTAFENAEKKLVAAKASAPDGDHKDLEAAVNTAKAAFDAADKELVDAKSALDALQANQQK